MSSRIDTLEPNSEPLAVLLASIVARLSSQDFVEPSAEDNTRGDIALHAERAVAGVPLGIARADNRIDPRAPLRLVVVAWIGASAALLQIARYGLAVAVPFLRNIGADVLGRLRASGASARRLSALTGNSSMKIAAGLALAALGLALVLVQVSGRLGRLRAPSNETSPISQTQGASAAPLAEERPLREAGLEFTRGNLRYCTFQQIRLEALGPLTEGADLVVFNALVEDWNARCTKYRYRAEDKDAVDAEAGRRRTLLEVEGRALMSGWRRKIVTTVQQRPASAGLDSGEAGTAAADIPEHTSDAVEPLPLLITLGRATIDEPDTGLSLRAPALALLRADVAVRVQRRLNDLGFTIAPVDGTWGPASRGALRRFKKANGLLGNDAFDGETVTRLFSTSAVTAADGGELGDETAAIETPYPPPPAAGLNPLNRADGQRIQQRLTELGYYTGRGDGAWGAASRAALRSFKAASGLPADEEWNAMAEAVLFDEQAVRAGEAMKSAPRASVTPSPSPAVPLPPKRPPPPAAKPAEPQSPGFIHTLSRLFDTATRGTP